MAAGGVGAGNHKIPAKHSPFKAANVVHDYGFTVNAEATDTITVNVQARDAGGKDLEQAVSGRLYLSDDSLGLDMVATAASGSFDNGTDGDIQIVTAGKTGFFTTEADGDLDVAIVHSGVKTCYLVLVNPNGSLSVSGAITFA